MLYSLFQYIFVVLFVFWCFFVLVLVRTHVLRLHWYLRVLRYRCSLVLIECHNRYRRRRYCGLNFLHRVSFRIPLPDNLNLGHLVGFATSFYGVCGRGISLRWSSWFWSFVGYIKDNLLMIIGLVTHICMVSLCRVSSCSVVTT